MLSCYHISLLESNDKMFSMVFRYLLRAIFVFVLTVLLLFKDKHVRNKMCHPTIGFLLYRRILYYYLTCINVI